MSFATPADVLARRDKLIRNRDADGFADLFAPDGVIEMPFTGPPAQPMRLEGRETIRAFSRQVVTSPLRIDDFGVTQFYETADPEVVIVETRTEATVTSTGRSFTATSIQVFRIADGQIVLFRDYADPHAVEEALPDPHPGN